MNQRQTKEFLKQYDKFRSNNLPTSYWNEQRQTLEYVYWDANESYYRSIVKHKKEVFPSNLCVERTLTEALGNIAFTGFYYSFQSKYFSIERNNEELEEKIKFGHKHAHSFEEVVHSLYDFPESFQIPKEDEEFYSKQELAYLRRVQKYLLFIGLKDLEKRKPSVLRYRNKNQQKYSNVMIHSFSNDSIEAFLHKERNFFITEYYSGCKEYESYSSGERRILITDLEDNFKLFIECISREVKSFADLQYFYPNSDLTLEDKVLVTTFQILETYDLLPK